MKVNYAIVFVSDMSRSVAFYRDTLGLPLRFESAEWTEFATTGSTIALHATNTKRNVPDDPLNTPAGSCRTGFCVPDLSAYHRRLVALGVVCAQEPKNVHGAKIAMYVDPDGMGISVSEERKS